MLIVVALTSGLSVQIEAHLFCATALSPVEELDHPFRTGAREKLLEDA